MGYSDLLDVAALGSPEIHLAVRAFPRDATGAEIEKRAATRPRLWTEADDDPADAVFECRISLGWTFDETAAPVDRISGGWSSQPGDLIFENADAALDDWLDLNWIGARIELYVGAEKLADGSSMAFSRYWKRLEAFGLELRTTADGDLKLRIRSAAFDLAEPYLAKTLTGWGRGYQLAGDPENLSTPSNSTIQVAGDLSLFARLDIADLSAAPTISTIIRKGFASNANYHLFFKPSGSLCFEVGSGGSGGPVSSSGLIQVGTNSVAVTVKGTSATLWHALDDGPPSAVAIGEISGVPAVETQNAFVGRYASEFAEFTIFALALANVAWSEDDVAQLFAGPVSIPGDFSIVAGWSFENTTSPDVGTGAWNITTGSGGGYVPSLTGANPVDFPDSSAGASVGWVLGGPARRVELAEVDRTDRIWSASGVPARRIRTLEADSARLIKRFSKTIAAGAIFDSAAKTLTLDAADAEDFLDALPGQTSPALTGQTCVISGSASNNGSLVVAAEGISGDGKTVTFTGAVVNETTSGAITVASLPSEEEWEEWNLSETQAATIRLLVAVGAGLITGTIEGTMGASTTELLASEAIAEALGASVSSSLNFDPRFSWVSPFGSEASRQEVVDVALRSCRGYLRKSGTSWELAHFPCPAQGAAIAESDPQYASGSISKFSSRAAKNPPRRIVILYDRNWTTVDSGLPGSLTDAQRRDYRQIWRRFTLPTGAENGQGDLEIETGLTRRADAQELAHRLRPWALASLKSASVSLGGGGYSVVRSGDEIWLSFPAPGYRELQKFVVTRSKESLAARSLDLEILGV